MQLTFLGTGTSGGVPSVGCSCQVCQSTDPHDKRLRSSALIETATTRVLIDCGPDFRQQILPFDFKPIDGVLLTHIHYDHVGGLDDIRPFCRFGPVNIYTNADTAAGLRHNLPYCFADHLYPGVPLLHLHEVELHKAFTIGDLQVVPIQVMHGQLPILGFRIGSLAYITDMKTIAESEMSYLEGTDTLVVNALRRDNPHHAHQLLDEAVAFARRVGARRTLIIHCTHNMGFHEATNAQLPKDIQLAYDGQVISLP